MCWVLQGQRCLYPYMEGVMTLTVRADCPACNEAIRVPLLALDLAEGWFLAVDDEVLSDHVETCEVVL